MASKVTGTVLVAIDGSHNSLLAAGVGARLARLLGAHVGLVHVLDLPAVSFWVGVEARMRDDIRRQAEATLSDIAERIRAVCELTPEFFIIEGAPELVIHRAVRENPDILMVVTGRQGIASEKRADLKLRRSGHLGARLSELLPVPVLVVPPDVPESHLCTSLADLTRSPDAR